MHALVLVAAEAGESQLSQIAQTFGVDWPHLGAQIVSFGIVCSILYAFAYKRILTMLEERRQQIALGIANAERIKAELDRTEAERLEVIAEAYAQSAKIIDEARAAAGRVKDREILRATATAEQIIAKAHEAVMQDSERMRAELKRQVGHWVVQTVTAVTGKVLIPEDQRRLAEEAAKTIAA